MRKPRAPLFLDREVYRRRRLMDAARLLPVVGVLLFLLPLLWAPQETAAADTARGGLFLFLVWAGLILAAFLLSRGLMREQRRGPPDEGRDGGAT